MYDSKTVLKCKNFFQKLGQYVIFIIVYIKVRVYAGSKKEEFKKISNAHFEAKVKEKAERNMANRKVIELVRNYFKEAGDVRIINGHHSPSKILSIDMVDEK